MVATNLKAETMSLMDKREVIEGEMNAIIATLCQPGGPGISGNLVDSEVSNLFKFLCLNYLLDTVRRNYGKIRVFIFILLSYVFGLF